MDFVCIEGLECQVYVGVPLAERRKRQKIHIDMALGLHLSQAGKKDDVKETVDYAAVAAHVKEFVESKSFRLVEAIAEKTARLILNGFAVDEVRIRVKKYSVPGAKSVGVEIIRR